MNETYTHIGIVVPDLEASMARFQKILGLTFIGPIERESKMTDGDGHDISMPFRLAYGTDGPPYYELIELQPEGGYYRTEGFHHVGWWSDDLAADTAKLAADGVVPELTLSRVESGGTTAIYFAPGALRDLRVELVDSSLRDGFFTMLADPQGIR